MPGGSMDGARARRGGIQAQAPFDAAKGEGSRVKAADAAAINYHLGGG